MDKEQAVVIKAGKGRRIQKRRTKASLFGPTKQKLFLDHFAATCNARAAAEAAGVSLNIVYKQRSRDPNFQAAWETAQELGYSTLEAALVQRAIESVNDVVPDEAAMEANYRIPFKDAMALLQYQAHSRKRSAGDMLPRRSDLSEATRRLEQILKKYKVVPKEAEVPPIRLIEAPSAGTVHE